VLLAKRGFIPRNPYEFTKMGICQIFKFVAYFAGGVKPTISIGIIPRPKRPAEEAFEVAANTICCSYSPIMPSKSKSIVLPFLVSTYSFFDFNKSKAHASIWRNI